VYGRWVFWTAFVALGSYYVTESIAQALLFTLVLYAIGYVAVVLHELGHAVTAVAVGFRVPAFSIGGGLHTKVVRWRDTFLLLGLSPIEGLVVLSPRSPRHYRKKMALILVAGSAANLLCAAIGYEVSGAHAVTLSTIGSDVALLFTGVNLLLVLNLLPIVSNGPFGALRSDGLQLLDLLKVDDAEIEKRVSEVRFTEAYLTFLYGDLERAHALIAPALESGELKGKERTLATAVLINLGRTEEGIALARRYLADGGTPDERAMLMNNLAWALADPARGKLTPATLGEADELSASAMDVLPMANAVRGTRGAVLVEKGAYREAIELLADKRFRLEPRRTRAAVKAALALALAGLGDTAAAAKALQEAADLDPRSPHVRLAQARLAGADRGRDAGVTRVPA
jgi:tetratricopeptide (TPR) repeat protein